MAVGATAARALKAIRRVLRERPWWPLAIVVGVACTFIPFLGRLDLLAYDLFTPRVAVPTRTVLVAIDEASIAALGQWPWPREVHARMVDRLASAGAGAVGYAVLFSEPQTSRQGAPDGDRALADALATFGHAVLPVAPVPLARGDSGASSDHATANGGVAELGPMPMLRRAVSLGHADVELDADGVVRRLFLRGGAHAELPALSVALAEQISPELKDRALPGLRASRKHGETAGVWQRDNEVLLPLLDRRPVVWSFADALDSPDFERAVKGKAVLVGVTARGLGPELALAGSGPHTTMPAVKLHALAYDAFMAGAFITPWSAGASALLTIAALLSVMALWPTRDRRWQPALLALSVLLPLALCWLLLRIGQSWWGPVPATLGLLAGYGAWLAIRLNASSRAARQARRDARITLDAIGDAVLSLDQNNRIAYLNAPAQALARQGNAVGLELGEAFALEPESGMRLVAMVRRSLSTREVVRLSGHLVLRRQGEHQRERALSATISPLLTESGEPEGVVIALGDQTDAVASAQRLNHAATHDTLTGLPNRSLVHDRLTHATARALRSGSNVAVLFMDLDRFKRINDSLGHHLGDDVLRITGQRLLATCRANDTVGRWGGDEFVVVLEDLPGRDAIATVARKIVDVLSQPMTLDGIQVPCSCSVGIALAPDDGSDVDELLAMADAAMYRAKSQVGTHFQFYSNDLNRWTRDRLAMEMDMRQGLKRSEFELHYQPQLHLASGLLVGFEALLRWRRVNGDVMMPAQFIALAEESGLIVELGEWVVREAARQIASWVAQGLEPVPVAVNVSARQCLDRHIVEVVGDALASTGINPALLKIEITESTAMTDADHAIALFDEVRALGVRISVDDFGTGYSSLSRLKRFPIGELKIDRSFVQHMTTDTNDAAIVRATIALAHGLGLHVVAEGVETQEQKMFLTYHDCDVVQGFLYGRPQPAALAESLLSSAKGATRSAA